MVLSLVAPSFLAAEKIFRRNMGRAKHARKRVVLTLRKWLRNNECLPNPHPLALLYAKLGFKDEKP